MSLGNIMLAVVVLATAAYIGVLVTGLIALWPFGVVGLAVLGFMGAIFGAVVLQRLGDKEGEHYSRNVKE